MHRERLINRRQQGDLGEASAIEWLTSVGATVLIPFGHSPDFDLVAEMEERLVRIQVKTSTQRAVTPDGHMRSPLQLATNGGNQSWSGVAKRIDPTRFDYLFALTGGGRRWFIPSLALEGRNAITLGGPKYSEFEIERSRPIHSLVYREDPPLKSGPAPGEYPRGQRTAAVNRQALPSQVRLLPPPSPVCVGETTIRPKRRITIPVGPATAAGVKVGDRLTVEAAGDGTVVLSRIEPRPAPEAAAPPAAASAS
jgi:hypothetical protein